MKKVFILILLISILLISYRIVNTGYSIKDINKIDSMRCGTDISTGLINECD